MFSFCCFSCFLTRFLSLPLYFSLPLTTSHSLAFVERKTVWILNDKDRPGTEFIQPNLQGIHKMAFSNQFYFVASALTYGSLLSVYGAVACVYNGYQVH